VVKEGTPQGTGRAAMDETATWGFVKMSKMSHGGGVGRNFVVLGLEVSREERLPLQPEHRHRGKTKVATNGR
jgi:hypothetical protein